MLQQLCLFEVASASENAYHLPRSQIINKWTVLESNWLRQVRTTRIAQYINMSEFEFLQD